MARTFKPGHAIFCKKAIPMIYAGENELIYFGIEFYLFVSHGGMNDRRVHV